MALLHKATVIPSKLELLQAWAPKQPWFEGNAAGPFVQVGHFRLDDPAGEVGVETLLVRAADGPVIQYPLTYRDAPLPGGEDSFIGNTEHSVLGTRWVYDGPGDPVYVATTTAAIRDGGHEAQMWIELDGVMTQRVPTATVIGSGADAIAGELELVRLPGTVWDEDGYATLSGTWTDHPERTVLARIRSA